MHFESQDWLHLGTFVMIAHLLGAAAAYHAVLNTRTSQGAVAWAVSLVAMPYFTLIPYLFLGRSKFAGYIDARRLENEILRKSAHPTNGISPMKPPACAARQPATPRSISAIRPSAR
jgi:cardiolipin synthase